MIRAATLLLILAITFHAAVAAELHISPTGDDAAAGTAAAPFATVARAQQGARAELQKDRAAPVAVIIHGGTYRLSAPIAFTPNDSGTAKSPVIYRAADGEHPVLSGGVQITGWKIDDKGWWHVALADVKSGKWNFEQLFVNDQRRFRPRLPKQGYYKIAEELPPTEASKGKGHDRFVFSGDELRGDWVNLDDVEVCAMHIWTMSRMRIGSIDAASHTVTFTGHTRSESRWSTFAKGHRYLVDNVKESLGAPGEWYLDRPTGELTYVPMAGEKPENTVVVAPRLEQLVTFTGDAASGKRIENIKLVELDFAHANWTLPPQGQSFPQAEVNLGAAITLSGAEDISILACVVRHIGQYAISVGEACANNEIMACELYDLGGGGVKIGAMGGKKSWGDGDEKGERAEAVHTTVSNCTIAYGGRIHPAAEGVWIGHSPGNAISHNDIFDFYYTAVSVGWVWGYGPSLAHHNTITDNRMHTIGQGVLSDMAAVYTLGISPGTVVSGNVIHDIDAFDYGGWGLYTDEGSTEIEMSNNLVYRTKTGGFHQHYGRDNRIINNIFVEGRRQQLERTRVEEHNSFFFQNNIVYSEKPTPIVHGNWFDKVTIDHNLYWVGGAETKFPEGLTLAQWREKHHQEEGSVVADPLFEDAAHDDYRLKENSPAAGVGFKRLDFSGAGPVVPALRETKLPIPPRAFP